MKLVHVAVGVVVNTDGKILIAKRAPTAHQGGLWEFPGGKVDAGENGQQALVRELHEELAIKVLSSQPLIQIRHHYPDKSVLLDVYKVTRFDGKPRGNEGQPIQWIDAKNLYNFEFPAANHPIITAINLPSTYLITGRFKDEVDFSSRLHRALTSGIRLVQLRVENFNPNKHRSLLAIAVNSTNDFSANLIINCNPEYFAQITETYSGFKIGLHLSGANAMKLDARPIDKKLLLGVSCHNANEIAHAQKIGTDYLLVSPVLPTGSHPNASPLEWGSFSTLIESANIPVYALGGVGEKDIKIAQDNGAQGVAGISAWW